MKDKLSISSVYFSTIYNKLFYIVTSLIISISLCVLSSGIIKNTSILAKITIIVYWVAVIFVYYISKILKKKQGKLEVRQLSFKYKAIRIIIMLLYTIVESVIIQVITFFILVKSMK